MLISDIVRSGRRRPLRVAIPTLLRRPGADDVVRLHATADVDGNAAKVAAQRATSATAGTKKALRDAERLEVVPAPSG
jgi:hypothetical protein